VDWGGLAWAGGGYLAGTLPSTLIVAKAKRATSLLSAAGRRAGETDPHILMVSHLGVGWSAFSATLDVLKAFGYLLAARQWGHVGPPWLALAGVTLVIGHAFPFYGEEMAGRGLAASAGAYLVLLPVEMVVAGLLIVLGGVTRTTGLATTIAMAAVPLVALLQGQPAVFVVMGAAIFAILLIRRLEGVGDVVREGYPLPLAILYRCLFDSSGPPPGRGVWQVREHQTPPP
jgi:acyl phosphate:glycerol-3-phosphate acyltransferase